MADGDKKWLAACGLDCGSCDIRRVPEDSRAAETVVAWFHREGWLKPEEGLAEVLERKMYCTGCHGDRAVHWSADCWILKCCVDEKGFAHCDACSEFPCDRLTEWAKGNEGYAAALEKLKAYRACRKS
ncbi:MAG: DUF3795 domain-containing protein [Planctomycetota bacterium]|jgi:hypothetical protein